MIQELQTGILDINNKYNIDFSCKQLDNIILKIIIYDKSLPADLSNYNCRLKAFKADQVPLIQNTNITIKDNVVTIKADKQLTTTNGIVKAELQFINKTTLEKKSTFYLEIKVAASVLDVDGVVSTPTCTILEEIDNKLDQIEDIKLDVLEAIKVKNDLNTSKIDANSMNNTLKATTTNADNKKKEVETAINNASNKIKEVQDSTNTANSTKQAVDNSVVQANSSKQALDTSKLSADNTKKEVDNSIKIADEKIEIIKNLDPEHVIEDVKKLKEQVLENTYTKIETDSTLTKLESCKDSFVHNMQIKGRTLQNEFNRPSSINIPSSVTLNGTEYTTSTNSPQFIREIYLKANTEYTCTFLAKGDSNGTSEATGFFRVDNADGIVNNGYVGNINTSYSNKNFKFTTDKHGVVKFNCRNTVAGITQMWVKDIIVLEGDYTNKEIPEYFEGIKSTGEAEGNKISILSHGKNLWNGTYQKAYVGAENGRTYRNDDACRLTIVKCKPNTNYIFSKQSESDRKTMACFDNFPVNNSVATKSVLSDKITTDANSKYLVVYVSTNREEPLIQIEEGTESTAYEEYKEDKTEILISSPHMGIGDVQDIINFDKNERIKNVCKDIFDGSDDEGWSIEPEHAVLPNTIGFRIAKSTVKFNQFPISDKFVGQSVYTNDVEGVWVGYSSHIWIRISKSKLVTQDVAGFKKWLQANQTIVYYQLANPIKETLQIKDTLQSFENGYIMLDNAITPTTSLEYSTNLPSAIGSLTGITDKLVDDVTNVEITISDMDAEIGEARKGKTTLEERLEEDRTNILNTIGNVNVETDGDIASQLKNNKNNIEKAVQKLISINDANIDTIFENGRYRCYKPQSGFPAGYTKDSDFFLINYNTNDKDTKPWARQTLYDIRSNRVFIRSIRGGVISPWQELATVDDTDWIDLPLLNGATTTSDKAIYRRIGKMVYFKGVVNNITTDNFIFGNLPIGFRPNSKSGGPNIPVPLFLPGEDIPSRLTVYQNGNLQLSRKNDKNTCYLDGVMFVLD
ncbi:hypothetical protein JW813_11200 [Clostridium botulinum]|uniref:pyocin knob domain-containing protein n=1 Tax=Clostridium botulinum TaxID=1491 RepID=UPI00224732D0|nr:pyocin knob domain-containing protein [Clostridium botulinum]UZP02286.1 hypothetical protein JW813_11200 [Clostridium botulinum]UZP05645.1 hypothetical protein JYA71_11470 [Clostridium botulinum]UZP09025.1 hypothetical protein JYA74_11195 [Clostridium botulinum]